MGWEHLNPNCPEKEADFPHEKIRLNGQGLLSQTRFKLHHLKTVGFPGISRVHPNVEGTCSPPDLPGVKLLMSLGEKGAPKWGFLNEGTPKWRVYKGKSH